jgi:hypothetical protein
MKSIYRDKGKLMSLLSASFSYREVAKLGEKPTKLGEGEP